MEPLKEPDNEGEYLEMADHLKKLYEEMELKNNILKEDKIELQKILLCSYGLSRVIDNLVGHLMEVPGDLVMLVEHMRGFLSDELDTHVFNIKDLTFD